MHRLKSDIIYALQGENISMDKIIEIADICDAYVNTEADRKNVKPCEVATKSPLLNACHLICESATAFSNDL